MVRDHLLYFPTPKGETRQAERFDVLDAKVQSLKAAGEITTSKTEDEKGIKFGNQDELLALFFIHHLIDSTDNSPLRNMYTGIIGRYASHELSLEEAKAIWNRAAELIAGEPDSVAEGWGDEDDEQDWFLTSLQSQFESVMATITDHARTREILEKWK